MEDVFVKDKVFRNIIFRDEPLTRGEYESCSFIACDFTDTNLSNFRFTDCEFSDCNLSLIKINGTSFQNIIFNKCKILGLHFEDCNPFGLSFQFNNSILNHSSFYKVKTKGTVFSNSQLHSVDFADSDFSACIFDNCDLLDATFDNTILEKTDFRTSYNYSINPLTNRIKKAKFSLNNIAGLLQYFDIEIE